jgi:hypothetical protein
MVTSSCARCHDRQSGFFVFLRHTVRAFVEMSYLAVSVQRFPRDIRCISFLPLGSFERTQLFAKTKPMRSAS